MPDAVSVAMAELAGALREGLLALAVGAGLAGDGRDRWTRASPRWPARRAATTRTATAVRHGTEDGSVTLGGRRVPVRRPRVRTADRTAELAVAGL